jgi:nicotinate-nucleotide adenylyltransferase
MVVSPQNPLKNKRSLANDHDRLHLVNLAINDNPLIKSSNIEFSLPKPSFTIDTLAYLKEKYPKRSFVLIMGGDNLSTFYKWKNYKSILANYQIYLYNRPRYDLGELADHPAVHHFSAPLLDISASYIRNQIKEGKSIQYLVPEEVYKYLDETGIYERLLQHDK